jgi:hypothetical protein
LPIALAGTRAMRPKHSKWFGKAHACAKILPAIPTTGMTEADIDTLREQTRTAIAGALPDLRARYGTGIDVDAPAAVHTTEDAAHGARPAV